jgi:hypothetical protein
MIDNDAVKLGNKKFNDSNIKKFGNFYDGTLITYKNFAKNQNTLEAITIKNSKGKELLILPLLSVITSTRFTRQILELNMSFKLESKNENKFFQYFVYQDISIKIPMYVNYFFA